MDFGDRIGDWGIYLIDKADTSGLTTDGRSN